MDKPRLKAPGAGQRAREGQSRLVLRSVLNRQAETLPVRRDRIRAGGEVIDDVLRCRLDPAACKGPPVAQLKIAGATPELCRLLRGRDGVVRVNARDLGDPLIVAVGDIVDDQGAEHMVTPTQFGFVAGTVQGIGIFEGCDTVLKGLLKLGGVAGHHHVHDGAEPLHIDAGRPAADQLYPDHLVGGNSGQCRRAALALCCRPAPIDQQIPGCPGKTAQLVPIVHSKTRNSGRHIESGVGARPGKILGRKNQHPCGGGLFDTPVLGLRGRDAGGVGCKRHDAEGCSQQATTQCAGLHWSASSRSREITGAA